MTGDESAIRKLIEDWMAASKAGDTAKVLSLMTEDAVFMVPGREPFGKEAFATMSEGMKGATMEGVSEIQEIEVLGDWAWCRNRLKLAFTRNAIATRMSGYTLTIFRKDRGAWRLARDTNLVMPE